MLRLVLPCVVCQDTAAPYVYTVSLHDALPISSKSARVCLAARGDPVIEFGLRRAQGADGALSASRAAYIGGERAVCALRSEEHTSELQSRQYLVCRLLLEKKKQNKKTKTNHHD